MREVPSIHKGTLTMKSINTSVTSHVAPYGGVPTLFVNGEPQAGLAYITYFTDRNHYGDFGSAGYRLFSFAAFFASQSINETSQIGAFSRGIFDIKGEEHYEYFDEEVERLLAACPSAYIFPRVNMSVPAWWEDEHPEECNDHGFGEGRRRACFASKLWRQQTEIWLRGLIAHIQASPWCEHIVGYQLADGNTEEWFPFEMAGSVGQPLRDAWEQSVRVRKGDFERRLFSSEVVADAIGYFASVVKECTHHLLVVGSFYGYTLETPFWGSCHLAVRRLLRCPDIDFICSPASYMNTRSPGQDWPCMTVLDSLKLHGKLYFTEWDTRTYLSRFIKDVRPEVPKPGTYEQPIWLGPDTQQVTLWMLRQNVARQLTHGTNGWWFDMWGGWYADEKQMAELSLLRRTLVDALQDARRESLAEVAVFVDETAYCHFDDWNPISQRVSYMNRHELGLAGAPYDIYDITDFENVATKYKAVICLVPWMTDDMANALRRLAQWHKPVLMADAEHQELTIPQLRAFYRECGVFDWCPTDDAVYVCENYIGIHAATGGEKTLRLPRRRKVTPVAPQGEAFECDEITLHLEQFETRLFRLD